VSLGRRFTIRRFDFRLQRILWYKEQRERLAEIEQKQAAAALRVAEDQISGLQDQLGQTADVLHQQAGGTGLAVWLACYAQAVRIGTALEAAEARAAEARQNLREANSRRKQANIEVEGILTLRHKHAEAHRKAEQRAEQERGDELALGRWQAAKSGLFPIRGPRELMS
jgi:flagellar export protein FliJ